MMTGRELLATSLLWLLVQLTASQQQQTSFSLSEAHEAGTRVSSETPNQPPFVWTESNPRQLSLDLGSLQQIQFVTQSH